MKVAEAESLLDQVNLDGLLVHGRIATAGIVNEANIHGWQLQGWQFLHNGQVFDYTTKSSKIGTWDSVTRTWIKQSEAADTDSLVLFQQLVAGIGDQRQSAKKVIKAIRRVMQPISFWGRAALYDLINDRMFLIGDWYTYLINNQYVIISSADLNLSEVKTIKTHGFKFETAGSAGIADELIDGLAVIERFSQPDCQYKHFGELKTAIAPAKTYDSVGFADRSYQNWPDRSYKKEINEPSIKYASWTDDDILEATTLMKNQYGQIVETFEDSMGIHDVLYTCCMAGTCDLFTDLTADELASYYAGARTESHREPLLL
jgi:hypothetical protein